MNKTLPRIDSGQIIVTSHDFIPKGSWGKGNYPLFHENLGWWNIYILAWLIDSLENHGMFGVDPNLVGWVTSGLGSDRMAIGSLGDFIRS